MVKYLVLRKVNHLVLMKVEVTVSWMELKKRTRLGTKTVKYLGLRKD
jgi:ribosomal protein L30/L7E